MAPNRWAVVVLCCLLPACVLVAVAGAPSAATPAAATPATPAAVTSSMLSDSSSSSSSGSDSGFSEDDFSSSSSDDAYFDWWSSDPKPPPAKTATPAAAGTQTGADAAEAIPEPMFVEDYTYDLWQDDRCEGEEFGQNATSPCELVVEGGTEITQQITPLAGLYKPQGCKNGRPLYVRQKEEGGDDEDRFIIFSGYWGDWDFSKSSELTDESTLGYGGEGDGERRPELIKADDWYVLTSLSAGNPAETDFVDAPSLSVHCQDMCNDGLVNNGETGIDCGGPCPACVDLHLDELATRNSELAKDLAALRLKIAAEQKAKEEREQQNKVAKVAVSLMIVGGAAIVLGGPIIYYLKKGKNVAGGIGPQAGVAMGAAGAPGGRSRGSSAV